MLGGYDFATHQYFQNILISYFPRVLQNKFRDAILMHKLRNEIIATVLTNACVNLIGCTFFHELLENSSFKPHDIMKAFVIVCEVFSILEYWRKVEELRGKVPPVIKMKLFYELQVLVERNISWVLRHHQDLHDITTIIEFYKAPVAKISKRYKEIIPKTLADEAKSFKNKYSRYNIDDLLLDEIAGLKFITPACDIALIASETEQDVMKVGKAFYDLGEKMHFSWMMMQAKRSGSGQYVDGLALGSLIMSLEDIQIELVKQELQHCLADTPEWKSSLAQFNHFVADLKASHSDSWVSLLTIANRRVKEFLKNVV
jgi:glutamate dehydrogenase